MNREIAWEPAGQFSKGSFKSLKARERGWEEQIPKSCNVHIHCMYTNTHSHREEERLRIKRTEVGEEGESCDCLGPSLKIRKRRSHVAQPHSSLAKGMSLGQASWAEGKQGPLLYIPSHPRTSLPT